MLPLLLVLAGPAAASPPGDWVAVAEDTRACIVGPAGSDAPCVRLTGRTRSGAWIGRRIADEGETVRIAWERPARRGCVDPVPHGLADLGLEVRVPADALLPQVAADTAIPLPGGATLDLRTGQPLLPGRLDLGGAVLALAATPDLPTVLGLPGPPPPPTWPRGRDMHLSAAAGVPALAAAVPGLSPELAPGEPLPATWLEAGAVAVADHCARLVVPWDPATPPGRPVDRTLGGSTAFDREGVVPVGAIITLPDGHPVGRSTRPVTLGEQRQPDGTVLPSPRLGSRQGGRTCFTLPAAAPGSRDADGALLDPREAKLELCVVSRTLQ